MADLGIAGSHRTTILPEGGRDFLRRRLMELVGVACAALGMAVLMAVFTFSNSDPSLNHATGTPPTNLMGLPGAYACRETDGVNTAERYIRVALVHDEKTTREGLSRLAAVL